MKILLTGASSFTGYWFARTLIEGGHEVVAPLRGGLLGGDDPLRTERVSRLARQGVELLPECAFGSPAFLALVKGRGFDVLCHHAAEVGNYRSPDFDIAEAAASNTRNLRQVLAEMASRGTKEMVLTGSFFEAGEGAGTKPLKAFSPYALSKGLAAEIARYRCEEAGVACAKFVIPHPFGPLEQPRLGTYLANTWKSGKVAEIKTPAYVRDNIHVGLLASAYRRFVEESGGGHDRKLNPSGYVETQGAFVQRLSREVAKRTGLACGVSLLRQESFPEPMIRINTDPADQYASGWNEAQAWDAYAETFVAA